MRIGEVVGGAAVVGVAVLVGIAITDDGAPEIRTADTSPFVFAAESSPPTGSTDGATASTAGPATSTAPDRTAVTTSTTVVVTTVADSPATTTPATTAVAPATTTVTTVPQAPSVIPPDQRAGIAVRVLNGGAPPRAATTMSEVLSTSGFSPVGPADAARHVPATRVIFGPGRELDAATVNEIVGARPENIVPAAPDDPNWSAFGGDLAVLVVLGPAGT